MLNLLIVLVVILAVVALASVVRVFELGADLRGHDPSAVTESDNRTQSTILVFAGICYMAYVFYQIFWGPEVLPVAASVHGVKTDFLLNLTWAIILPVFFITHILLIYFGYKYFHRSDRKSDFFAHSTKLEAVWTIVPTIVLSSLIVYGLSTWQEITGPTPEETMVIELYSKQFDWTARYAGDDNRLGPSGYRLIEGGNTLGVDLTDAASNDDKVVRGEFHLPVGKPVLFKFHSRDVIHSAYMPHFRTQMNCVPGMTTQFHFVPTMTTAEMRVETGNPEFDYLLLCNKICGAAHNNMQMNIIVESEADFNAWLAGQKTLAEQLSKPVESEIKPQQAEVLEASTETPNGI
ncbi:MAG: cytochrome c oxidase subunit II [Flavobacteriales bacterium]|nr:cytochrome c oxidase subunit II [Flavobacteriales bacterium]